jgi:predicted nucleic acid-binding protein
MLVHLDTSVLVDAFSGAQRSLPALRSATAHGDVASFCTIVLYEWRRGPRTDEERQTVEAFFSTDVVAVFGPLEAARAADLFRLVKRARQRQADLAIAACAIEARASLWTLNRADFRDIPGLSLYDPPVT